MSPNRSPLAAIAIALGLALAVTACKQHSSSSSTASRDAAPPPDTFYASDFPIDAPPAPATRDVRPASDAFFAQLEGDHADTWRDAHADFRAHANQVAFARTLDYLHAVTGKFAAIADFQAAAGARPGDNAVVGIARFERGVARFQLTFRDDGDTPRLVFFNLNLPKDMVPAATPAGAREVADRAAPSLASGRFDGLRGFLHPATDADFGPDSANQLRAVTANLGAVKTIDFVEQKDCKGAQCVVYEVTAAHGKAKLDFTMTTLYGQWMVREFHLVLE